MCVGPNLFGQQSGGSTSKYSAAKRRPRAVPRMAHTCLFRKVSKTWQRMRMNSHLQIDVGRSEFIRTAKRRFNVEVQRLPNGAARKPRTTRNDPSLNYLIRAQQQRLWNR